MSCNCNKRVEICTPSRVSCPIRQCDNRRSRRHCPPQCPPIFPPQCPPLFHPQCPPVFPPQCPPIFPNQCTPIFHPRCPPQCPPIFPTCQPEIGIPCLQPFIQQCFSGSCNRRDCGCSSRRSESSKFYSGVKHRKYKESSRSKESRSKDCKESRDCKKSRKNERCRECCQDECQCPVFLPVFSTCFGVISATLTKTASPTTYTAVGDLITYTYVLTNTGTDAIRYPVRICDDKLGVQILPAIFIAPGGSQTFTRTYTITPADLELPSITNCAIAYIQVDCNIFLFTPISCATINRVTPT